MRSLADVLSHGDHATEQKVLDRLTDFDGELASLIRQLLFTLGNLLKLDDRAIQLVVREVGGEALSLAVCGVNEDQRTGSSRTCPDRAGRMMLEEIQYQPPQRKQFIEQAEGRIAATVRRLEASGRIIIPSRRRRHSLPRKMSASGSYRFRTN